MNIKELNFTEISDYLKKFDIQFESIIKVESAGDGNMNITLRVSNEEGQTLILKQSPPYCEKYPSIPAPEERVINEAAFYQIVNKNEAAKKYFPKIKHIDQENFIISMEDLGIATDYSDLYQNIKISEGDLIYIVGALNDIHHTEIGDTKILKNMNMRKLNHEYIFVQPLESSDSKDLGRKVIAHNGYKGIVKELGRRYLEDGNKLCHGDYYPASWLKTDTGIKIIDPEFAFIGLAEFDYGVLYAHLVLSNQDEDALKLLSDNYQEPKDFNLRMAHQYAGIEIMRRLIGVAKLPLTIDKFQTEAMLDRSMELVLKGE